MGLSGVCVCLLGMTHMAKELIGEPQIVVQSEDCYSLESNHDNLKRYTRK